MFNLRNYPMKIIVSKVGIRVKEKKQSLLLKFFIKIIQFFVICISINLLVIVTQVVSCLNFLQFCEQSSLKCDFISCQFKQLIASVTTRTCAAVWYWSLTAFKNSGMHAETGTRRQSGASSEGGRSICSLHFHYC